MDLRMAACLQETSMSYRMICAPQSRHLNGVYLALNDVVPCGRSSSTLGYLSILPIHEILGEFATTLLMSIEWCLRWSFGLWSNPRKMSSLTIRPIEYSRMSRNAILSSIASAGCLQQKARRCAYIPDNHRSRRPLHSNLEVLA